MVQNWIADKAYFILHSIAMENKINAVQLFNYVLSIQIEDLKRAKSKKKVESVPLPAAKNYTKK